jgi:hypothetical protein
MKRRELAWQDMTAYGYPGVRVQADEVEGRPRIVRLDIYRPEGLVDGDVPIRHLETILALHASAPGTSEAGIDVDRPPTQRDLRIPKQLLVPEGRRYRDDFYRKVADLYSWCAVTGVAPAPALAKANGKPESTVHAWVKEARRRGVLAPARKQGSTG